VRHAKKYVSLKMGENAVVVIKTLDIVSYIGWNFNSGNPAVEMPCNGTK
jgi:hypothetical protein